MANDGIEVVMEIFLEIVPRYIGAFLKWIYEGFKTPYTDILEQKGTARIGYVALGIMILLFLIFFNV